MKIDDYKKKTEAPKTAYELKQEEKKEQTISQPADKPQYGSPEYELRGIGWNVKQINEKLGRLGEDMETTLQATNRLLDDVIAQQKETNRKLDDILSFLRSRFTLNQ